VLTLNSFEKGKDGGGRPIGVRQRLPQRRGEGRSALHGMVQQHGALRAPHQDPRQRQLRVRQGGGLSATPCTAAMMSTTSSRPEITTLIVDASPAVWDALGLDQSVGMVDITWSEE
jgi:hypothetical protein